MKNKKRAQQPYQLDMAAALFFCRKVSDKNGKATLRIRNFY
jgi:hypothetical protein